jgi:hypothetical protein
MLCFCLVFLHLVYTILSVFLDCQILIAPSLFSNVYFITFYVHEKGLNKTILQMIKEVSVIVWIIHTNIVVLKSNFCWNWVMNIWTATKLLLSLFSTLRTISVSHSNCFCVRVTHRKYTWKQSKQWSNQNLTIQRNWQNTRWRNTKQKHNIICVGHHYAQTNKKCR